MGFSPSVELLGKFTAWLFILAINNDCLIIIWFVLLWLHALFDIIVLLPTKILNDLESKTTER